MKTLPKMDYQQMTSRELEIAVMNIVRSSRTDEEIQRRVREELGYPHDIGINNNPSQCSNPAAPRLKRIFAFMTATGDAITSVEITGPMGNTLTLC